MNRRSESELPWDVKATETLNLLDYGAMGAGMIMVMTGIAAPLGVQLFLGGAASATAGKAYKYART